MRKINLNILVRCNLQCLLIQFVRIKRVTNCANEKTQFAHMSERKDRFVRVCASIIHCAPRDWRSAAICIGESEYRTLVTHADADMAARCTVVHVQYVYSPVTYIIHFHLDEMRSRARYSQMHSAREMRRRSMQSASQNH
jgi:hypothetical protein